MGTIKKNPIRPPRLQPGDTIGIVAPASPFDVKLFDPGIRTLQSMGFQIHIPDDIYGNEGYLAGSDALRADVLHRLFADQTVDAIVCAKGGYGSLRILPLLDFALIENNPKIFVGHSDISALLSAIYSRTGLVTFHGPLITTISGSPEKTRQSLVAAISSEHHLKFRCSNGTTLSPGVVTGPLCGGNLATLSHLLGTPFAPGFKDHILFLEDRAEAPYRIDRMLTQMKLAGCFQHLAGLILGDFVDCGPLQEIFKIFSDTFADSSIPILAGFEAGHGNQNLTIPFGLEATLDADNHKLSFLQPATL